MMKTEKKKLEILLETASISTTVTTATQPSFK